MSKYDNFLIVGNFNSETSETAMSGFCDVYHLYRLVKDPTFYKNPSNPSCNYLVLQHFLNSAMKTQTFFFFFIWVFSHDHSRITGLQGKGEGISLTPHYHFHPLHRHLDISRAITTESSPLHIASSRTRTGNLWLPSASR